MTRSLAFLLLACIPLLAMACEASKELPADTGDGPVIDTEPTADTDGDTLSDEDEGEEDFDNDGIPNLQDLDSDGDGVLDADEAGDSDPNTPPMDTDGDGWDDYRDLDSDNDTIPDSAEAPEGELVDTDGDGLPDLRDTDSDGDWIPDQVEVGDPAEPFDTDGDGTPDYLDLDSDGDGLTDYAESDHDDTPRDSDGDGLDDYRDTDSDDDWLSDGDEADLGTDPYDSDSDDDGYSDGMESTMGRDPLTSDSSAGGGVLMITLDDSAPVEEPLDFNASIWIGDVAFVLDTTGSMSGTANALANEFAEIVAELAVYLPDAAYGYATFEDYCYDMFGTAGDIPFRLQQQITTDSTLVEEQMVSYTTIHSGADWTEASHEALYQSITGVGYDQNCDALYDASTDILPFIATETDPFGGTAGELYDPKTPGTGVLGGFGFRDGALPLVVHATDAPFRDPDDAMKTPGGCPDDAGQYSTIDAFNTMGARYIGVDVGFGSPTPDMSAIATGTSSLGDLDGDTEVDDPLVFYWTGKSDTEFRATLIEAIIAMLGGVTFSTVSLEPEGDSWGFITAITPETYTDVRPSDVPALDFDVTFELAVPRASEDQRFAFRLNLLGDGHVNLGYRDVIVFVPADPS